MGDTSQPTPSDPTGQLHVFRHYSHSLGMNGTKVSVLKQFNQIGFSALLKGGKGASLDHCLLMAAVNYGGGGGGIVFDSLLLP